MISIGLHAERLPLGKDHMWNFTRDIRVNDTGIMVIAGTSGTPVKGDTRLAGFGLFADGADISVRPAEDDDGFVLMCHGDDAVEALKEAISHLYRVIVMEKADIREVEAIEELRRKKS